MSEAAIENDLSTLRAEIDRIDSVLLDTLRARMGVVRRVAEYKRDKGIAMMAPDRVEAVYERAEAYGAEHDLSRSFLREVFEVLLNHSFRAEDQIIDGAPVSAAEPARGVLARRALGIDHVAIAVRDLEAAIETYTERYGFELIERRQVSGSISGMDSATMRAGGVTLVLCQGDSPESNVSRYIEHYGPGVQHVAIAVEAQGEVLADLKERGCDLLTDIIHAQGLDQSFTKRDSNSGIQFEFVTRTANDGFHDDNVKQLFEAMERENVY